MLVSALALGGVFRRFRHAPLIGEVLAGLILGPSLLALVDTNPASSSGAGLSMVATLGVFFVVFAAGIEIGRSGLRQAIHEGTAIVAVVEFIFPFYLGTLLAQALHLDPLPSLLLATGMAVTALPVSVRILIDFDLLQTKLGRAIVSVAVVNDIIAFAILGVILALQATTAGGDLYGGVALGLGKILLFILLVAIIGWLFLQKRSDGRPHLAAFAAKLRRPEAAFGVAVSLALGMGALAELLGIHFVVGVFYAGIFLTAEAVGVSQFALVRNTTHSVGIGFFAPVFFAYIGLRISIPQVDWFLVAAITAVAFLGKIIGGAIGGFAAGFRGRELAALGFGLNARGMMELLLADIGLQAGIITQTLYAAIVFMTLITTVCTPICLKILLKTPKVRLTP